MVRSDAGDDVVGMEQRFLDQPSNVVAVGQVVDAIAVTSGAHEVGEPTSVLKLHEATQEIEWVDSPSMPRWALSADEARCQ